MNTYVVCMDSVWVRNAEMFDIAGLADEELTGIDMCGTDNDRRWHDMEPVPFTAVMKAEVEEEACKKAAAEMRYDSHSLFAIKVSE
ncbi:hypothetical protein D3Z47_02105 [Lachnospiraceae bacterium]|nr:hypothetical protein [Lachnospiraceae bacterium]